MHGERNLRTLLRGMNPVLHPGTFAFCCFADSRLPPDLTPVGTFGEEEGLTAIVPLEQAQALGIDYQFESRMVTLTVHSALDAVGFLARITAALAEADIPCNVVSAYCHDHLFVPAPRLGDALKVLEDLSRP